MRPGRDPTRGLNTHHVFFEGRIYRRNHLLNRLRNAPGFHLYMDIQDHRDLHAELRGDHGVPVPRVADIQNLLDILPVYDQNSPRTQSLDMAIGWFSITDNLETAEHLIAQREFITRTEVPHGIVA